MAKFVFVIAGETCLSEFECEADALVGGHARLSTNNGDTVRVGEVKGDTVAWLGQWRFSQEAMWSPE